MLTETQEIALLLTGTGLAAVITVTWWVRALRRGIDETNPWVLFLGLALIFGPLLYLALCENGAQQ